MINKQFKDLINGNIELKTRRGWTNLDVLRSKSRTLRGTFR